MKEEQSKTLSAETREFPAYSSAEETAGGYSVSPESVPVQETDNETMSVQKGGKKEAKPPRKSKHPAVPKSTARRPPSAKNGEKKTASRRTGQEAPKTPSRKGITARTTPPRDGAGRKSVPKSGTKARRPAADRAGTRRKTSGGSASRRKNSGLPKLKVSHIHIAVIALILLIGIVGIVRLAIWNKGKESDYDPDNITTEFDTEPEDFFIPLDPQAGGKPKDDGVTTILLLGNAPLAKTRGAKDSIGGRLEALTGGKVYDASLDHTYLSVKNAVYDESYQSDVFSLYWITQCLTLGDFTLLEDNARTWDKDAGVKDVVEMLKGLDMDTVDVITIMYDQHDYEDERLLAGPYDEAMAASCCGCLLQSVRLLQQTFPHIRIIVSSPYFAYVEDKNGELQPGSIFNNGQGTLADYMIAYKNIAVVSRVSFIDNYFGTITEDNYETYLEEDKQTLNEKGRNAIAERIASFIGTGTEPETS